MRLVGTLDLEGGQFTLNGVTGPWEMMGGTFINGTVKIDSDAGGDLRASYATNTLDDVTVWGDLVLDANSEGSTSAMTLRCWMRVVRARGC